MKWPNFQEKKTENFLRLQKKYRRIDYCPKKSQVQKGIVTRLHQYTAYTLIFQQT